MAKERMRARRASLLFPLVVIALGVLLLLTNLGIVAADVWYELVRFWPLLLIVLGIDVLISRPTFGAALSTLLTVVVLITVAFIAIQLFGPDVWTAKREDFAYPLGSANAAQVHLSCDRYTVAVGEAEDPRNLIEGSLEFGRDVRLDQITRRVENLATYELKVHPILPLVKLFSRSKRAWAVGLHAGIPIDLSVTAAGPIDLDLQHLHIQSVDVLSGEETCTLIASCVVRTTAYLSGDSFLIRIPSGVGVRIIGTPTHDLTVPMAYIAVGGNLESPDYNRSDAAIELHIRPGVANLHVVPLESEPFDEPQAT